MDKVILVLDESGAKGHSNVNEKYPGEIGVMAGFVYPDFDIASIERCANLIVSKYAPEERDKKFHITDLNQETQHIFRNQVYELFLGSKIQWYYKAVFSEGFHQTENDKDRALTNGNSLLHAKLFHGMLTQALCMIRSLGIVECELLVRTDHLDKKTVRRFKSEAKDIIDVFLNRSSEHSQKHWNSESEELSEFILTIKTTGPSDLCLKDCTLDISCEESSLTILADVLANSAHYYLRNKIQENGFEFDLNSREAIAQHPLSELAYVRDDGDPQCFFDHIYKRREQK